MARQAAAVASLPALHRCRTGTVAPTATITVALTAHARTQCQLAIMIRTRRKNGALRLFPAFCSAAWKTKDGVASHAPRQDCQRCGRHDRAARRAQNSTRTTPPHDVSSNRL